MNKYYKFKKGQNVKLWDGFTDSYHYGIITYATKRSINIDWQSSKAQYFYDSDIWRDLSIVR